MQRITCFITLIFLVSNNAFSTYTQSDSTQNSVGVGINLNWGYLQYHHQEMEILKEHPTRAIEISLITRGNGNKLWHSFYRNPEYGITYKLMDLGSRSKLGYSHCIFPFINLPIILPTHNLLASFRAGTGLAFMQKIYNPLNNPQNSAISTHINAFINFGLIANIRIANSIWLSGGAHLAHFSNGSVKKPNYGLNYTLVSLGVVFREKATISAKNGHYAHSDEKSRILVVGTASRKEAVGFGGPKYLVTSGSVEYSYPIATPLFRTGLSLDFMYDKSNSYILQSENIQYESDWQVAKLGTAVSTEFILDKLSLVLYFGAYYHNLSRDINNQWVYQRIAMHYRLNSRIWAHIALKTHWNVADYLELGIAFKAF